MATTKKTKVDVAHIEQVRDSVAAIVYTLARMAAEGNTLAQLVMESISHSLTTIGQAPEIGIFDADGNFTNPYDDEEGEEDGEEDEEADDDDDGEADEEAEDDDDDDFGEDEDEEDEAEADDDFGEDEDEDEEPAPKRKASAAKAPAKSVKPAAKAPAKSVKPAGKAQTSAAKPAADGELNPKQQKIYDANLAYLTKKYADKDGPGGARLVTSILAKKGLTYEAPTGPGRRNASTHYKRAATQLARKGITLGA